MKKIISLALFHSLLGLVFSGCIKCPDNIIVGSEEIQIHGAIARSMTTAIDTVVGPFSLENPYLVESVSMTNLSGFGTGTAYAFSCDENYVSYIDEEALELYFDKPFEVGTQIIPANTNLFLNSTVKDYLSSSIYYDWDASLSISFNASFFSAVSFPTGEMKIRIVSRTIDGLIIENELDVFMDI